MAARSPVRVALLSDTHGTLDARIAAEVAACDYAVHAGDVGNAGVLAALQPRRDLVAVRGNNDTATKWPAEDEDVLVALPTTGCLTLPGGTLAVVHGHRAGSVDRRHSRLRQQFPDARAIVYGHSHRLICDQDALPWVLNPGAAGRMRTFGGPSCLILLAAARGWRIEVRRFPPVHADTPVSAG
ncbi:MAG: metallophosphoesterase family protein [Thiohalobacteraceae bacterium]